LYQSFYQSPAGLLSIKASNNGITEIGFVKEEINNPVLDTANPFIAECISELEEYFSGERQTFTVPLDPEGTGFQKEVWAELVKIPYGKTISYLNLAIKLGDAKKIRAVGGANGKNPIAIIVPCHRVIGSDGSLTGYAGGMDKKRWLLRFEGVIKPDLFNDQ